MRSFWTTPAGMVRTTFVRAGAGVARRLGEAIRDRRVDDVGEGELGVVEVERQPPAGVRLLELPAEALGRDLLARAVEDLHRVDDEARDMVRPRVGEADGAVVPEAGDEARRELPAPGLLALALGHREELLGARAVDDDGLAAELRLARDTVNVVAPLRAADVLRHDRDGCAPVRDGVALGVDPHVDARGRGALHRRLRLLRAERVLEEADVGIEATDAGDDDDEEEDSRGGRYRRGCPHGRSAAQDRSRLVCRAVVERLDWGDGCH